MALNWTALDESFSRFQDAVQRAHRPVTTRTAVSQKTHCSLCLEPIPRHGETLIVYGHVTAHICWLCLVELNSNGFQAMGPPAQEIINDSSINRNDALPPQLERAR